MTGMRSYSCALWSQCTRCEGFCITGTMRDSRAPSSSGAGRDGPASGSESASESSAAERRLALARELKQQREDEVLELHTARSGHYVDNAFSVVTANMAIVCLVLGGIYMSRACEKPLAGILILLGCLAPWAACLPLILRQWFYLHLRLKNLVTISVLGCSVLYVAWLFIGQRWAFASSPKNCDEDLSTAANAVVFVLYAVLLLYLAKVVWYLAVRLRYSYKQLCLSCFRDPYPNALAMTDGELERFESQVDEDPAQQEQMRHLKPPRNLVSRNRLLLDMQRHQHELRQSLHRLFQRGSSGNAAAKVTPRPARRRSKKPRPPTATGKRARGAALDSGAQAKRQ